MWHPVPANPLNFCRECGADFASLEAFDRHRVGSYEPNERRCLGSGDLRELGWDVNDSGRWHDPKRSGRASQAFGNASTRSA